MRIRLANFLESLSIALDFVEKEILNISPYHGQRVAAITHRLCKKLNYDNDFLFAITQAALLHDCALNEYFYDERPDDKIQVSEKNMSLHCKAGEKIISKLPFYNKIRNAVLYHHETADGSGAFGKKAKETPFYARLIHLADIIDVNWSLFDRMDKSKFDSICSWINEIKGSKIDRECADLFFKAIDYEFLSKLSEKSVLDYLQENKIYIDYDIPNEAMIDLCSIFADITDYKSHFTWRHSLGVAEKAEKMGKYYNYSFSDCQKLYIAGALHDIGKLMISNDILEKPGKLNPDEYKSIQNHAIGTYKLLENVNGLEEINRIASLHHEKLDGNGYPFGFKSEQLNKNERLMAIIDIYQALVEERPYKKGLEHNVAIGILKKMANEGQLDSQIIKDVDDCFENSNVNSSSEQKGNITTSINELNLSSFTKKEIWKCPVCGFIHEGPIPQDFICPRCEQPASIFEKQQ